MLGSIRTRVVAVASAAALSLAVAAPANAQQEGLVNVDIDVTQNQVLVQVPIGVAANVCGVNAAVLATGQQSTNPVCEASADNFTKGQQRAFNFPPQ